MNKPLPQSYPPQRTHFSLETSLLEQEYKKKLKKIQLFCQKKLAYLKSIYSQELNEDSFKRTKFIEEELNVILVFVDTSEETIGAFYKELKILENASCKLQQEVFFLQKIIIKLTEENGVLKKELKEANFSIDLYMDQCERLMSERNNLRKEVEELCKPNL